MGFSRIVHNSVIGFIFLCSGCALNQQPSYGPNELQKAILADNDSQLNIIWRGNYSDISHRGGYPTAVEMLLDGGWWLHEVVKIHGLEATLTATSLSKEEKQSLACENGHTWDSYPETRPILFKFGDLDAQCPRFGQSLRRTLFGHIQSHEAKVWAYGEQYKRDWHLLRLKYDPHEFAGELYVTDQPTDYGYTNQEALRAALVGGNEAAIERIIGFGADPDAFTRAEWQDIICESFGSGGYSHDIDLFTGWISQYGSSESACSPYYLTALERRQEWKLIAALKSEEWNTDSADFRSMLANIADFAGRDQSMYVDKLDFVTAATYGLGRDALHPPLAQMILSNEKALSTLIEDLGTSERHHLACRLLAQNGPLSEPAKNIVRDNVRLSRRCEDGQLPIMVAAAVPDNFAFVYKLDPAIYRRQVTKTEVLKAALSTGQPELILSVADHTKELLQTIQTTDLIGIVDQPDLLEKLESRGLPTKHRAFAELKGLCGPIVDRKYVGLINQSFFTDFVSPLSKSVQQDDEREIVLAAYRDCLNNRASQMSALNPFRSSTDQPPKVSEDIYAQAKAKTLYALTLLSPRSREAQDPIRARKIIYDGYDSIRANVSRFKREANEYAALQREKLDLAYEEATRRREEGHDDVNSATWKALGATAVIGGILAYNDLDPSQVVEMGVNTTLQKRREFTQKIEQDFFASIRAIEETEIEIPRIEDARATNLDKDGVRLLVPRYGSNSPYGSLNVDPSFDHTHSVIKLGSGCTGTVLSGQRILTAQHCLVDDDLKMKSATLVTNDFFSVKDGKLVFVREAYSGPWKYTTAEKRYAVGSKDGERHWQNDWIILEPVNKSDPNIPNFLKQSYLRMAGEREAQAYLQKRGKLAVSGYASHLNNGIYLTMTWGCSPINVNSTVFEYNCLGFGGDSGAPVIMTEGRNKGSVIGVHSYGRYDDGQREARIPSKKGGNVSVAHIQKELSAGRFITGVIE